MRKVTTLSLLALAALAASASAANKDDQTLKFNIPTIRELTFDHTGANASGISFSFGVTDFSYGSNVSSEKTAPDKLSILTNKAGSVSFSATALPTGLQYLKLSVGGSTFAFNSAGGTITDTLAVTPGASINGATWAAQANLDAPLTNSVVTVTATLLSN